MAEIRDRHQPQQVQVHPQYRYDNSAGVGYGGGGNNYHSSGPSTSQVLAVLSPHTSPRRWHTACVIGVNTGRYHHRAITSDTVLPHLQPDSGPGHHSHFHGRDGVLVVGAFGLTGLSSLEYVLKRRRGRSRWTWRRMQDMAGYVGAKTKEVGQKIETKAHEGQVPGLEVDAANYLY
ncbi:hypothetical protein F3Y22_tig00110888pilonHSYRG00094 [Hibiscus syriacus]|uniref:Uncharacterized protein n=1 Tax=Hibiscus syriacus TaxID=106335 RepID=A0A6A2ZI03_HIBSY|nr:hypothetical protein F3Y22_tig00110888pilonHSYRG00094 [Hibiscus syriacus]